jgi:LysM domain-containing protein
LLHACLLLVLRPETALAFPYVVQPAETLAAIAQRLYGRVDREALLVTANGLALDGGVPIVAGMRLEVPAVSHRRTTRADSWPALATELLGAPERAAVLAFANDSKPWLRPADGAEIIVPYNLRVLAASGETLVDLAVRFLGDKKRTWMLAQYNGMKDVTLERGQVVLVPLTDLPLTPEGRREAEHAVGVQSGLGGERRALQTQAASELPELIGDVRYGRYVESVARGERLLASEALSVPQRAIVHRQLLEAYAALGLAGRAADECQAWRRYAPKLRLSAVELSPKLMAACTKPQSTEPQPSTP